MQPETKFKNKVLVALRALPRCWLVKVQQVGLRGTPDILCCLAGLFVALELKRNDECEADPLQTHTLQAIARAGGISYVVSPVNWPAVYAALKEISCTP